LEQPLHTTMVLQPRAVQASN